MTKFSVGDKVVPLMRLSNTKRKGWNNGQNFSHFMACENFEVSRYHSHVDNAVLVRHTKKDNSAPGHTYVHEKDLLHQEEFDQMPTQQIETNFKFDPDSIYS
jgi:hypothetical protein